MLLLPTAVSGACKLRLLVLGVGSVTTTLCLSGCFLWGSESAYVSISVFRSIQVSVCLLHVCLSVWNWASISESALGLSTSDLRHFGWSIWLIVEGGDTIGTDLWPGPGTDETGG